MYFVAVCRMCVNYSSFVDLEGFLRLNSFLKRHPSGPFSGLFIIFNVGKFCSDYVNLKPMPPAVSPILAYMMCGGGSFGAFRAVLLLHHLQAIFSRSLRITLAFVFAN